ncbi:alpha-E domain-containing protein [Halioxenophilus sp. WMMB6]|uniref:alpha-E domain-containing protein n=1 Tax=Halioxenophilus sp. WMMB6 TaxID=3073815 RepID=UPI00295E90A9|nr:alpha-E domain-containing protein [Halioxenophilus sp. WMMB6]
MLARVAERLYWAARYLERAENTARLVSVYDNLLYDLPKGMIEISWFNLVDLNSAAELFDKRYKVRSERNVVKFLLLDDDNPSSLRSSVRYVRENFRTTRDVIPPAAWEQVNELNIFLTKHGDSCLTRARRHDCLTEVIERSQSLNGLLTGTLMRDAAWEFLKLGRCIERADMTTRILDAGAAVTENSEVFATSNPAQVIWGNVLRSQGAYMSYRRAVKSTVRGSDVAKFLLEEPNLPRSVTYCRAQLAEAAIKLSQASGRKLAFQVKLPSFAIEKEDDLGAEFRNYLNDLQLALGIAHNNICKHWFARD